MDFSTAIDTASLAYTALSESREDGGISPVQVANLFSEVSRFGDIHIGPISGSTYILPVSASDQVQPVPAGYPAYLPKPVIDKYGRLVLRPVPLAGYELTQLDVGYIMTALQPVIDARSKQPYPITYEGQQSTGYAWIKTIAENKIVSVLDLITKYHDFLINPADPSSAVAMSVVQFAGNLLTPGLGTIVMTLANPTIKGTATPPPVFPGSAGQPAATESTGSTPAGSTTNGGGMGTTGLLILAAVAAILIFSGNGE